MWTGTRIDEKPQSRAERVAEVHAEMLDKLGDLVSGDDWRRVLDVASAMHGYSPRNKLWLALQAAERGTGLSVVFGYRAWQKHGRQVRRGERGLLVLAPIVSRLRPEDEDDPAEIRTVLRSFRLATIFDVSQTDGDEWPDVAPQRLAGLAPDGMWPGLAAEVARQEFELILGEPSHPGANGETDYGRRVVTVRANLSPAQKAKTLAHELGHVLLHRPDDPQRPASRAVIEVEAESIAYLVCQTLDLPTDSYSFPYLAGWSGGDTELVAATAERVIATTARIVEAIEACEACEVAGP